MNLTKADQPDDSGNARLKELILEREALKHRIRELDLQLADREKPEASESRFFSHLWWTAIVVGLVSCIPVFLLRNHYPWAIGIPIIFGVVFALLPDFVSSRQSK